MGLAHDRAFGAQLIEVWIGVVDDGHIREKVDRS
jgi:hypothetical protein